MKVVAIGGGTGLSTLLRSLKKQVGESIESLSAIVTVADSGGSTGKLRKIYKIPAPGDIRNCLVALSESEEILKSLFQYRFKGEGLEGHAFGNLFLTALTEITGSFLEAIRISSEILKIKGEVIPSTTQSVQLCARFEDGKTVVGEEEITLYGKETGSRIVGMWIEPKKVSSPISAIAKVETADLIIFGPGSLYTSIIPNLLIEDLRSCVERSKALKVFVVNIMTQPGETDGLSASGHLKVFLELTGLSKVDVALVNTKMPPHKLLKKYLEQGQEPVIPDVSAIAKMGVEVYAEDLIGERENYIRHNEEKLLEAFLRILNEKSPKV